MSSTSPAALEALRPYVARKSGNQIAMRVPCHVLQEVAASLESLAAEANEAHELRAGQANPLADAKRVTAWIRSPDRAKAVTAFTAGPERDIAYAVEDLLVGIVSPQSEPTS